MAVGWDDVREADLRHLAAQSKSATQIAKALRVTRNAVIGKCDRLGIRLTGGDGGQYSAGRTGRPRKNAPPARVAAPGEFAAPSPPRRFSWQDLTQPDRHA